MSYNLCCCSTRLPANPAATSDMRNFRFRRVLRALGFVLLFAIAAHAGAATPPNIVFILADDVGWPELGCFGNTLAPTPVLDQLATQGVRLTDFYATSPVCSPTRAAILTGRYPARYGFESTDLSVAATMGANFDPTETLLPQYLKPRGYATACFGKWHLGFARGSRPLDRGFDEFLGNAGGVIHYFNHHNLGNLDMFQGNNPRPPDGGSEYCSDLYVDSAIDFIERHRTSPFFVYLPFNAAHWSASTNPPRVENAPQAPQAFLDRFAGQTTNRKGFLAALAAMDTAIGRLLARLDSLGLANNTLVVFCGDNGGQESGGGGGRNDPLKSEKTTLWEGGIRVPCIVRWPNRLPAGVTRSEPLTVTDLFALAISASGADTAARRKGPIDGRDPTDVFKGTATGLHPFQGFRNSSMVAIREGDWKLVGTKQTDGTLGGTLYLHNLASDIGEATNLATSQSAKATDLKNKFNTIWVPAMANDTALP